MVAITSLDGNESQTPSSPSRSGSVSRSGIRNITWRVRLRNIDFPALPIDWKKVVATIWKPTAQNASSDKESAREVTAISVGSVVNARAMSP